MHELEGLIRAAWEKVRVGVEGKPWELSRRLARRRSVAMMGWPRGWCLAVRASDRRIDEWFGWTPARFAGGRGGHAVEVDAKLVRRLVRPVVVGTPDEEQKEVARMLGTSAAGLRKAIERGVFQWRCIKGLGGRRGRFPVPLVSTREL